MLKARQTVAEQYMSSCHEAVVIYSSAACVIQRFSRSAMVERLLNHQQRRVSNLSTLEMKVPIIPSQPYVKGKSAASTQIDFLNYMQVYKVVPSCLSLKICPQIAQKIVIRGRAVLANFMYVVCTRRLQYSALLRLTAF